MNTACLWYVIIEINPYVSHSLVEDILPDPKSVL